MGLKHWFRDKASLMIALSCFSFSFSMVRCLTWAIRSLMTSHVGGGALFWSGEFRGKFGNDGNCLGDEALMLCKKIDDERLTILEFVKYHGGGK